ncbi:efflux RND transporter periplasmic adaptor subunit [Singulisphaera sp. PoT]|uniref:efflux RND transporter periplasmic adaptor subunit n=1 Tax=Singulisphaera sp. PoT TaxID=3411797 RepID=UPI003BF4B29D
MAYLNAKLEREIAEIAVKEYEEGIYPQEVTKNQGELLVAQAGKKRAEERLARSKRTQKRIQDLVAKGDRWLTPVDFFTALNIDERVEDLQGTVQSQGLAIDLAKTKQTVLEKFDREQNRKSRQAEVERHRSKELMCQLEQEQEESRSKDLQKQVELCKVQAYRDGIVYYEAGFEPPAESAAGGHGLVAENQPLFHIYDERDALQIQVALPESVFLQVGKGQKARFAVDAYPGQFFAGTVATVSVRPIKLSANALPGAARHYLALIDIDKPAVKLMPEMTAEVEILIKQLDQALTVPATAILADDGKQQVAVKRQDGAIEFREVTVGSRVDQIVEVTKGLSAGDQVVLDPAEPWNAAKRQENPAAPSKPADAH